MHKKITFVTALYDLGRGDINDSFKRSFDHYKECFTKLLKHRTINLLVYCDESLNDFVRSINPKVRIINKSLDDLRAFPFYDKIQQIRKSSEWLSQAGWLADSTQATLELYNPLVMSKQFFLNDASLYNFFNTDYFCWIDAGLYNTVNLDPYFDVRNYSLFEKKLIKHLNKMLYICFPYDGQVEVHGFKKSEMNRYAGANTEYVARGGFFGGNKVSINKINEIYYNLLSSSLNNNLMGTEESIFTLITYLHPDLCNIRMIEPNGLIYKFFDDVNKMTVKDTQEELAIYVLTYNLPNQFKYWLDNVKMSYPHFFNSVKKYVIDNSNDPEVDQEYKKLFEENGFTVFKFDNIGINGGRQFAAEHFDSSDHDYMIFFEDDMLFHERDNRCKSGFATYFVNWWNKCITIMQNENLDYLKLNYSEFFGDNFDNWAWHNMNQSDREKYMPTNDLQPYDKTTKTFYSGVYDGLPYSIGQYHYCNWPILFNKEGNKKVFLETKWKYKYEQTWMTYVQQLHHNKKIKAGCLLASITNHHRKFFYGKDKRRENETYKN